MNCTDFERDILLECTGELPAGRSGALTRHMATCAACRDFAASLPGIGTAYRSLGHGNTGPSEAVLRTIRAAAAERHAVVRLPWMRPQPALLALAAGLALVAGVWQIAIRQAASVVPLDPREARISEVSSLLAALSEAGEEEAGDIEPARPRATLRSLANQLLILQDMSVDLPDDYADAVTAPEESLPTTLQWHSTPEAQSERYG